MRKIVVLNDYAAVMPESFCKAAGGEFDILALPSSGTEENRLQAISEAEIIIGEPTCEELKHANKLRWLQMTWAGADRYLSGDFPKQVLLTNASGAFGETIAEHAIAMLLSLCRRLNAYSRQNKWVDLGCEIPLSGAVALVFGTGDIGRNIAQRLRAFGVHIIGVCRNTGRELPEFDKLIDLTSAEEYFHQADFLLCALPGNPQTIGYLNDARLQKVKNGAILVNVGRGSFIDTQALCEALTSGKLFGAGLDVVVPEPLPPHHPLWSMPNVILTPHVAGVGFGHLERTFQVLQLALVYQD